VLAHYAISSIYRPPQTSARVYSYDLEVQDQEVRSRAGSHLALGRLKVRSRLTWNEAETTYVVLHYGSLDFHTVLRKSRSAEEYEQFKRRLLDTYKTGSLADVTTLVAREFEGEAHRLDDLFVDEQRRVIGIILQDRIEEYQRTFARLADPDEDLLNRLGRLGYPIPKPLRAAASAYLDHHLREEIARLGANGTLARIQALVERGRAWGYQPEREVLGKTIADTLEAILTEIQPDSDLVLLTRRASELLDVAALLGIGFDLWQAQNLALEAYAKLSGQPNAPPDLRDAFVPLVSKLNIKPELLGWRP
jgi:hypothetical protein